MPPPLAAGAPQPSANPRDFNGAWFHDTGGVLLSQMKSDMFGDPIPFTAIGKKVAERRFIGFTKGPPYINASTHCLPPGAPGQLELTFPFLIFQAKDRLDFVFEEYHGLWEIMMDPARAGPPGYMGRSVGHWEGNTLVVQISGLKEGLWIEPLGTPISKDGKLTMRIRKVKSDHWYLEVQNTVDDPRYYTRPWSWMKAYAWRPDMTLMHEYDCELQVGDPSVNADAGVIPEPND